MIQNCYLITIVDSNDNITNFYVYNSEVIMHYEKRRNFGNQVKMDIEIVRFDVNWNDFSQMTDTTVLHNLFNFLSNALENKPCTISIDYYTVPIRLDPETGAIAAEQPTKEEIFIDENFVRSIISNIELGTITYDITPINDIISESCHIQLKETYEPAIHDPEHASIQIEENEI